MMKIPQTIQRAMKMVMEVNEASFPWYAAIVTVIVIFRLFSEDALTKIGISIATILGFFGASIALKLMRKAIPRHTTHKTKGGEVKRKESEATTENKARKRGNTAIGAAWIIAGAGAGIFISRNAVIKLHAVIGTEISEAGAWIMLGGLMICMIGAAMNTNE